MPAGPALRGDAVVLVPVSAAHAGELRRILATDLVRRRWGGEDASPGWPFDDPPAVRFAVRVDGAVRGMLQYTRRTSRPRREARRRGRSGPDGDRAPPPGPGVRVHETDKLKGAPKLSVKTVTKLSGARRPEHPGWVEVAAPTSEMRTVSRARFH
jgi:hypothetical protein